MKKLVKMLWALSIVAIATACKKDTDETETPLYEPTAYQVSEDGKTLIRWENRSFPTTTLDMQGDVNLRKVTELKESVFRFLSAKEVKLPDNLEVIGERAFEQALLTAIEIPKKITRIERMTFYATVKLRSLKLNEGLLFIGPSAFFGCNTLDNVQLPSTLVIISNSAFVRTGIYDITIPKNVTKIGEGAFEGCESLTAVTFESEVPPVLEDYVFERTALSHIYVPANSVDAYKAVPNLQKYASIIKAKP